MLTLGIETASDTCSVALHDGAEVLAEAALYVPRSHGRRLAPLIYQVFEHVDRAPQDLDLVAVSAGPGSYTGLRIGVSTAKGLALSTGAALVAVPTLDALAEAAGSHTVPLVTVLPSRRGEVYAAAYAASGEPLRPPTALSLTEAGPWVPEGEVAVAGPGVRRLTEAVADRTWRRLRVELSGRAVGRLGARRFAEHGPDDPSTVEPMYLKPVATSQPRAIFGV